MSDGPAVTLFTLFTIVKFGIALTVVETDDVLYESSAFVNTALFVMTVLIGALPLMVALNVTEPDVFALIVPKFHTNRAGLPTYAPPPVIEPVTYVRYDGMVSVNTDVVEAETPGALE